MLRKLFPGLCFLSDPPGVSSLILTVFVHVIKGHQDVAVQQSALKGMCGNKIMVVGGEPPETFIPWAVAENLRVTKVSSVPFLDWYNGTIEKLGGLGKVQSKTFKNQAENVTKDRYVFSKCVLDHDTYTFNKQALNGCVKTVKLKPQKWSGDGFGKPPVEEHN